MRIEKICKSNERTLHFKGGRCIECLENPAEFVLIMGGHEIQLCAECVWDIKDMIEETTFTDFVSVTRTAVGTETTPHEFRVVRDIDEQ